MTKTVYPEVPVLVVGGGSVGLLTTALLAHHGVPAVLVERRSGPSVHPRATGIGPRTVEALRELGLDAAVDAVAVDLRGAAGKAVARTVVEMGAGDVVTVPMPTPSADELDVTPFRLRGVCAQDRLDAVVTADLARRGADLRWSTRLVGITQDADGVDVELEGPDGRYSLRCTRVVAADGAHSTVRTALGVGTSGAGDLGTSKINILFRADLRPHLRGLSFATCTITTPEASGLLVTVDGERDWVFHVTCDVDGGERPEDFTPERCAAVVRAAVGDPDLDVEVRSVLPWRPRSSLADRFAVGRVFLVGDAAHTVSPLGAFGLNTGVADAHNLAWKLAAVHRGEAGAGLLDTYAQEREPVAAATIDQAARRYADPRLHWGRGPEADEVRAAAGVWAAPVVHLGQRYDSTAVVDPRPELPSTVDLAMALDGSPGSRVPHAWVDGVSTLDLVASRWTLLVGTAGDRWSAAAAETDLPAHRVSVPWLPDDGALLVRPDAIVAMRVAAPVQDPARFLAGVLDQVLARPVAVPST
ncbi:2-polyprenyl-6-methoxyphenol hydroxylase-like FAD-dependent oxidoreductase [Promicromonospora sp. AC04]|uniref:FAD-dependent monooxygenase n=1 Tax=Promicromonospora sp. AC04 TaxID=2135723 RepID=UPI000D3658C0|nr:FAD-dependent monooxygenase [Promicromonospora sp. AC04]PUB24794.1 2-polyprenyl-6-methoxyphenol hydroxylase-like FAD-dependent oxidoreductase [Promicromonospora sp. AC04]